MTVFWDLLTIPFYEIWGLTPSIDIKHPHCMVPVKFEFILYIHHGERHWGDGYTGLGQLFRCPGIEGTKIRNFQFQTVAETFAIFAKSEMPLPILKTRSPDWGLIQFPKLQQLTRNSENVSATLRLGGASLALGWAWAWWLGVPSFSEIWETTIWFLWALRESRYRRLSMSQLKIDGTGTGLQLPLGLDDNPLTNHQA